jgi:UDP-glucose 4-epimerase
VIFGDGSATRDFVSVHDVVDMVMLMLEHEEAVGKVFNCGTGKCTTIKELAGMVIDLYGKDMKPVCEPERKGDIKDSYADISKATDLLGYQPKIDLRNGLTEMKRSK